MDRSWLLGLGFAVILAFGATSSRAEAQQRSGGAASPPMPGASWRPGTEVGGRTSPVLSPYLVPFAAGYDVDPRAMGLYLLALQRARGGLGSGRLSGLESPAVTGRRPAEMPRSLSRPGGAAAGYFGNSRAAQRVESPYGNRHNRYFLSNGR